MNAGNWKCWNLEMLEIGNAGNNKEMNAGNSITDNKNPTSIKEYNTNCVIAQSETTTNKEKI